MHRVGRQNEGGYLEMGGWHIRIQVFLEIPNDAHKKNLAVFSFPLLTDMCYKTNAQKNMR